MTTSSRRVDAGSVRLALYPLYPLGLLRDMAAPDSELLPEDAWNGVTLAIKVADREAVDTSTPLPWRPALGNRWQIAWLPGYR